MAKEFGNLYLDTNILRQFDFDIHNDPRFTNLKAKLLSTRMFIPRIVFEEWLLFYRDILRGSLSGLKQKTDTINKYVSSGINLNHSDVSVLEKELAAKMLNNLKEAGIEIFETPYQSLDLKNIVDMAIQKLAPFQESDKGFKDVVILFSIIEHCKCDIESKHLFLTANKNDFDNDDARRLISEEKADLELVFSIEDLTKHFDSLISRKVKEWLDSRRDIVKRLLVAQKEEIIDFIKKEGQFDEWFLKEGLSPFAFSIQAIKEIEFIDILNPSVGFLEEEQEEGNVEVYFSVAARFTLSVIKSTYETPKFKIGEQVMKFTIPQHLISGVEVLVVDKNIPVKGKLYIKKDGINDKFAKEIILEDVPLSGTPLQRALLGLT